MISLIITIAIIGFAVWLLTTYVPMPPLFRSVIFGIAALALIVVVLNFLGFGTGMSLQR